MKEIFLFLLVLSQVVYGQKEHPIVLMEKSNQITIKNKLGVQLDNSIFNGVVYIEAKRLNHISIATHTKQDYYDNFNMVIINRHYPYRIRPIIDFSTNGKEDKDKKGRFINHSVIEL